MDDEDGGIFAMTEEYNRMKRNAARWEAARKVLFKEVASENAFRLVWETVAIKCKASSPEEWADRLIAEEQK